VNKEAPLFRKSRAFEDLRQLPPPESLCAMNRALRHPIGFWDQLLSWPGKRTVRKTSCTRPGSKRSSECAESRRVSPSATTCAYRVLKRLSWNQQRTKRDSESLLGLFDASFNSLSSGAGSGWLRVARTQHRDRSRLKPGFWAGAVCAFGNPNAAGIVARSVPSRKKKSPDRVASRGRWLHLKTRR